MAGKGEYNADAYKADNDAIKPFLSEPWCDKLLSDPSVTVQVPFGRRRKASGEDEMFARTLNNNNAISDYLMTYKTPKSAGEAVEETTHLLRLGSGLNGFPGITHGGIVATLLDEATGSIAVLNMMRGAWPKIPALTAYLNTTYIKPVPTSAFVLCRSWLTKVEGRKLFLSAVIEDGHGNALAKAEALYIYRKDPKL